MDDFVICPSCSQRNKITARFCARCGSPIPRQSAKDARPRERRSGIPRAGLFSLAGVFVVGLLALGGWLAGWPAAVFSATPNPAQTPVARQAPVKPSDAASTSPSPTPDSEPSTPDATPSADVPAGPASTVAAYYAAINGKDYRRAWALGGSATGSSYPEFTAGFATTAKDTFTLISVSRDVVTGRLSALQTNGSTHVYEGTYTVSGNAIDQFNIQQVSS